MRAWKVGPILVPASRSNSAKTREVLDRTFKYGIIPRLGACFASRIGTVTMGKVRVGCEKRSLCQCEIWRAKSWHWQADIFLPLFSWGPFCQGFRLWTVQTIGTVIGTKIDIASKSRQKSSPKLPDTPRYGRAPKNRWKSLKIVAKRWKTLKNVANRWKSILLNRFLIKNRWFFDPRPLPTRPGAQNRYFLIDF